MTRTTLSADQRRIYAAVADVLVPATETMPSASAAGVVDTLIDDALGYRPDLAEDFAAALSACADREPEVALDELTGRHPAAFAALTLLTASAYTLSPQARTGLGYRPAPRPVVEDIDTYIDMLAAVVERGFHIR